MQVWFCLCWASKFMWITLDTVKTFMNFLSPQKFSQLSLQTNFFAWKCFIYPRFNMRSSLDKKDPFHRQNKREENETRVVKMYVTITKGELTRMVMEAVGELFIFKCIFIILYRISVSIGNEYAFSNIKGSWNIIYNWINIVWNWPNENQ